MAVPKAPYKVAPAQAEVFLWGWGGGGIVQEDCSSNFFPARTLRTLHCMISYHYKNHGFSKCGQEVNQRVKGVAFTNMTPLDGSERKNGQ